MNSNISKITIVCVALSTTVFACSSNHTRSDTWDLGLCEESSCPGYLNDWYLTEGAAEGIGSTWHQDDAESVELKGDTTILSTKWLDDEAPMTLDFLLIDKSDDVTLEVWIDYLEKDYQTAGLPLDPPPSAAYYLSTNPLFDISHVPAPTDRAIVPVTVAERELSRTFLFGPEIPTWVDSVAVHIVKKGPGTATIARISLNPAPDVSSTPWGSDYDTLYYYCTDDADCSDALFCESEFGDDPLRGACSYCASDDDCSGVSICGSAFGSRDCVVPHAKPLGEACAVDEECKEGVCCNNHCSSCCEEVPCEDDQACTQIYEDDPYQCDPGQGRYPSGALCYRNEDCESGVCTGEAGAVDAGCPPEVSTDADLDAGADADSDNNSNADTDESTDVESDEKCISMGVRYGQCE